MDTERSDTWTLSYIRHGTALLKIDGIGPLSRNEEVLFSVTCTWRGQYLFVLDTTVAFEAREATGRFDATMSAQEIAEHVFEGARERWENAKTYTTSV